MRLAPLSAVAAGSAQLRSIRLAGLAIAVSAAATLAMVACTREGSSSAASAPAAQPALTVTATQPQRAVLPLRITANGNIAAWQEASVGSEVNGLRLASVRVNVGDVVERGQVLATFAPDTLQADVAQTRAAVAGAQATLAEAAANADRARALQSSGALSEATITQSLTAERTAQAQLDAQRALLQTQQLRLSQTQVRAPDSGVISARNATVGAVSPAGQELFRLIRQGRLEWRAEVAGPDLARIETGMPVRITLPSGEVIEGRVRMVAPTVDPKTRNGLVYVDLRQPGSARAGMFARGDFEIGSSSALTLPQSAVLLRDGFSWVLRIEPDSTITQLKVDVGRRVADRIEIKSGLEASARVVASGGGFLGDGDLVRVVAAPPVVGAASAAASAPTRPRTTKLAPTGTPTAAPVARPAKPTPTASAAK